MEPRPDHDAAVVSLRGARAAAAPPDPDQLLTQVGRGDQQAFAAFHDLVVARVFGIVRSVLRDPARSEEVTQEVMLELWRTAPRYQASMGRAVTWALTIAHRRAVDRVRSEQASRDREQRHHDANPEVAEPDVSLAVEDGFDRARVRKALTELTPAQRESIELAFYAGHSHTEVAALLDLPLGTVKTRIRDGLIRLRDRLEVMA
jgi:RNA polymerase sigma-70 factor (ECF subfamily)